MSRYIKKAHSAHTDGLYEIEFHRMYEIQGRILTKINKWTGQIKYYEPLRTPNMGPRFCKKYFKNVRTKLNRLHALYSVIERCKEDVSCNNPKNGRPITDYEKICAAYEQAYENTKKTIKKSYDPTEKQNCFARMYEFLVPKIR